MDANQIKTIAITAAVASAATAAVSAGIAMAAEAVFREDSSPPSSSPAVVVVQQAPVNRSAMGSVSVPFELDETATIELKMALHALASRASDPLLNPIDPATERSWTRMALSGPFAGAWDGPSSDELVTALSRYAKSSGISGPYVQLQAGGNGRYGINGGPQPTPAGLEVIAGAVETILGGAPRMSKYLAWRGGVFAPPSSVSGPGLSSIVIPNPRPGKVWQPDGYTTVWPDGDPEWVAIVGQLDDSLVSCWEQQLTLTSETARRIGLDQCILSTRASRDQAVRKANEGVPSPICPEFHEWDATALICQRLPGVIDLPEVVPTDEMCIQAYMDEGKSEREARELCHLSAKPFLSSTSRLLAVGAAVGISAWFINRRYGVI